MPSGYAVGSADADSPGGGFLQGFAVCMEGLEDEAAVDCGRRAIPNLSALCQKQISLFTMERIYREREVSLGEQTSVLACMKSSSSQQGVWIALAAFHLIE